MGVSARVFHAQPPNVRPSRGSGDPTIAHDQSIDDQKQNRAHDGGDETGGLAFVTTPFNFRIHGPLPDCWRFTEHGLRALFREFDIVELTEEPTPDRPLMPIHYRLVARRP